LIAIAINIRVTKCDLAKLERFRGLVMILNAFTISLFLFLFSGCATLASGTWDRIRLGTTPSGAKVTDESGAHLTTTPGYITIKRRETPKLTFSKEGYEDVNVQLTRKINKKSHISLLYTALGVYVSRDGGSGSGENYIPLFLIHGACSYVIDLLTGAIWDHDESIDLKMIKTENKF
jgi:hypothetical protein